MLICVGNLKGGTGKTTLAINIAIAFSLEHRDVLLIDGDKQGTAMAFTQLRSEQCPDAPTYTAVALYGSNIRTQVRQLEDKYRDIIIDVGGQDTGSFRAALTVCDLVLVPVQPRSFDLWSAEQVAELIVEARDINEDLIAVSVLNAADPAGKDNEAAAAALQELKGVSYLPTAIVRRKAFPNAAAAGKSVLEYGDEKAAAELRELLRCIAGVYRNGIGVTAHGNQS